MACERDRIKKENRQLQVQVEGMETMLKRFIRTSNYLLANDPDIKLGLSELVEQAQDLLSPTPAGDNDRIYPCRKCGILRTKAEGGTTFTVCDKCWDDEHPKTPRIAKL